MELSETSLHDYVYTKIAQAFELRERFEYDSSCKKRLGRYGSNSIYLPEKTFFDLKYFLNKSSQRTEKMMIKTDNLDNQKNN